MSTKLAFNNYSPLLRVYLSAIIGLIFLPPMAFAAGAIAGYVRDVRLGNALSNARVVLIGVAREQATGEDGSFKFSGVPVGTVEMRITYLGMHPYSISVDVVDGDTVYRDIELTPIGMTGQPSERVKMEVVTVVADREASAQAMAFNDQLLSPNTKNVVALDEYGNRKGSIGQFLSFLPGVTIGYSGPNPTNASLRGFPGNFTDISIDGAQLSSTHLSESRGQRLEEVSTLNISRVEVTKVPTPDRPASGLGGSINLISRSPFESRKRRFSYDLYGMYHSWQGITLDGGPRGDLPYTTYKYNQPSVELTHLEPLGSNLALSLGYSRYWEHKPGESGTTYTDETPNWNIVNLFQRRSQWNSLNQVRVNTSVQAGLDWRITSRDTISFRYWYQNPTLVTDRRVLDFDYGAGAAGGPTYTQGAATGVGSVNMNSGANKYNSTRNDTTTLRYDHSGDVWRVGGRISFTDSNTQRLDIDKGFFHSTPLQITQAIIRGDNIPAYGGSIPTVYSVTNRAGVPIDVYDGGNYSILRGTSQQTFTSMRRISGDLAFSRELLIRAPLSIKFGVAVDLSERDNRSPYKQWNFRPDGKSDSLSRQARNFDVFDDDYLREAPNMYGKKVRWVSGRKIFNLFQEHPEWFVLDETFSYRTSVVNTRELEETISAGYIRVDSRLLENRLWIVAGARYERTDISGRGPLVDPGAIYERDEAGDYILVDGKRVQVADDPLEQVRLQYMELGASSKRNYDGIFPSINATYRFTEKLLLRMGWAETIGRPEVANIVPGITISAPEAANPTITVSNTGLKPWAASNYDLSLESYQIRDGVGSVGVFHKSIRDFHGRMQHSATPELLALYGLSGEADYDGYSISTMENVGDATVRGFELSYRQSMNFLPRWARGVQAFVNFTRLDIRGSNAADFTGFSPKNYSTGISLTRPRYFVKLTYNFQDAVRTGMAAPSVANGIPENTATYQPQTERYGLDMQYNVNKRLAIYLTITDLTGFKQDSKRYAPDTPAYARSYRWQELGYYTTIGVRGMF